MCVCVRACVCARLGGSEALLMREMAAHSLSGLIKRTGRQELLTHTKLALFASSL